MRIAPNKDAEYTTTDLDEAAFLEAHALRHIKLARAADGRCRFTFPHLAEAAELAASFTGSECAKFARCRRELTSRLRRIKGGETRCTWTMHSFKAFSNIFPSVGDPTRVGITLCDASCMRTSIPPCAFTLAATSVTPARLLEAPSPLVASENWQGC